jgi:DNA-directed RNA polymerase subunit RPC12/RpoP
MEFFRHCPGCGRRFHIKLVNKKLVSVERGSIPTRRVVSQYRYGRGGIVPGPPAVVLEGEPVIIDIEEFQYVYKCGHCGHEWSEKHVEEHREE